MKMNPEEWIPFIHENLDYKQQVLKLARERDESKLQDVLMATLIYVNAVDYVASHLLSNLRQMTYYVLHAELNATVFYENADKNSGIPLGKLIERLKNYEFPDKNEFLKELTSFKKLRDKYIHTFLKLSPAELEKSGFEIGELYSLAESILNRYDTLVRGITTTWITYRQSKVPTPSSTTPEKK